MNVALSCTWSVDSGLITCLRAFSPTKLIITWIEIKTAITRVQAQAQRKRRRRWKCSMQWCRSSRCPARPTRKYRRSEVRFRSCRRMRPPLIWRNSSMRPVQSRIESVTSFFCPLIRVSSLMVKQRASLTSSKRQSSTWLRSVPTFARSSSAQARCFWTRSLRRRSKICL